MVGKVLREVKLETEQFAWLLLLTIDRTQAKGSTIRVVDRRAKIFLRCRRNGPPHIEGER